MNKESIQNSSVLLYKGIQVDFFIMQYYKDSIDKYVKSIV
jgi:hypothetical protein